MSQLLTVELPNELYARIKNRADVARRSVEQETVELLASTVPASDGEAIASLALLDDTALQCAADCRLSDELAAELESLHFKQQREGLTHDEAARSADLVRAYERSMLVRSHAAVELKKRGLDLGQRNSQS